MRNHSITALILAGGAGRRVNGQDKGLIEWQGQSLVSHVYNRIAPQVRSTIISCNRNIHRYRELAPTVSDIREGLEGPLAGIEAATSLITTDYLLVVGCDTPNLPPNLAELLLQPLIETHSLYDIAYAHDGHRPHYLCAVIRSSRLQGVEYALDHDIRAVKRWYAGERTIEVKMAVPPEAFANHNY